MLSLHLHLGAHRTATTTFQHWLRQNAGPLAARGIVAWEPKITRAAPWLALCAAPGSAGDSAPIRAALAGALAQEAARLSAAGLRHWLISEENLIGGLGPALAEGRLYPALEARLARLGALLPLPVASWGLGIRALPDYWISAMGLLLKRGMALPGRLDPAALAASARGWAEVAGAIAAAFPQARGAVWTYEALGAAPARQLAALLPEAAVPPDARPAPRRNRAPTPARIAAALPAGRALICDAAGRLAPFTGPERATLAARHAADLAGLRARAGAAFTFLDETA